MKTCVQRTVAFIGLLALVLLSGWNGMVEGRLPADFGVKAKQHIEALVKIGLRQAGTLNKGRAAGYIAEQFKAMGVAALLAAAETLAAVPPARSILLLASTAEEEGMIGSRFFVEHPLVPLSQIAFVLNNDGAGVYEPGIWCIGGLEKTTAGLLAESAGQPFGLVTRPYPEKYRYLYAEGDSISFVDQGIPSLTVSPGFAEGDEERTSNMSTRPLIEWTRISMTPTY